MKYVIAFLILLSLGTAVSQTLIDSVIADVKGHAITRSELENELRIKVLIDGPFPLLNSREPTIVEPAERGEEVLPATLDKKIEKQGILDAIIARKFVLLEAEAFGITLPDDAPQLAARMGELISKYSTEIEFHRALQQHGLEIEIVKEWIHASLIYEDFFRRKFHNRVTPEESSKSAREYFEEHRSEFKGAAGRQKTYAEVSEELSGRFRQQIAKSEFDAWLAQQKAGGDWYILDPEFAELRLNPSIEKTTVNKF